MFEVVHMYVQTLHLNGTVTLDTIGYESSFGKEAAYAVF